MNKIIPVIAMAFLLVGCAGQRDDAALGIQGDGGGGAGYQRTAADHQPHAGQWAVAAIGTPFYLVFKTAVCGASIVIAAPTAAIIALADSPYSSGLTTLGDGVAANCGPPYVLSPG